MKGTRGVVLIDWWSIREITSLDLRDITGLKRSDGTPIASALSVCPYYIENEYIESYGHYWPLGLIRNRIRANIHALIFDDHAVITVRVNSKLFWWHHRMVDDIFSYVPSN